MKGSGWRNVDIAGEFVETDLSKIKKLAKTRENENWEFRAFLKESDFSSEEIDRTVHELYQEISLKIDCAKCANCCREMHPLLDDEDIEKLSVGSGLTEAQFKKQYLVKDEEYGKFAFKIKPCPFLGNNGCNCYEYRPKDCQSYPHLDKEDFVFRLIEVVQSCSVCPIVFNVYERLKLAVWSGGDQNVRKPGSLKKVKQLCP
jgi:Fe-S-cluster containining protein